MDNNQKRRTFVAGMLSALTAVPSLADVVRLCPGDGSISDQGTPLTIDTHAHFFNGSDLQIKEFLSQTTVGPGSELYPLVNAMSGVIQSLAWHVAPSAKDERMAIARYASLLNECDGADQLRRIASPSYQEGYAVGRRELQLAASALNRTQSGAAVLAPKAGKAGLGAAIADLPVSWEVFEELVPGKPDVLQTQPTLAGFLRFLLHHFNYRHVNAIDYLATYSKGSSRKVDLVVASMVDYDWWLARGRATPTSLTDQIDLMGDISVLLGGRVHGFAPFCPFRETMTADPSGMGDGMRMVQHAIEARGCIGVKIYPPMGFAPLGNSGKTVWANKRSLHAAAAAPDFGERLDVAMRRLFTYCQANDVPIMAHTNNSNGPYRDFEKLAGSLYWQIALETFPGLKVSFGHFGDSDPDDHAGRLTRPFLNLMTPGAGSMGEHTFADSGYFAGAMVNQGRMRDALRSLYASENRIMLERLMYGSDWTMILTQKNVKRYLSDFVDVMRRIEAAEPGLSVRQTSLSNAFFGSNAAEFLGLRSGRGNRVRLETFYAKNQVPEPDWMRKIGNG